jgi:phosphatidate cytidylyltransferase
MLRQRIITAVIMLAALLPALFYPQPWPFALLTLLLMAAAAWEWGRLNALTPSLSWAMALGCTAACVGGWWAGWLERDLLVLWVAATLVWVLGGAFLLAGGVPRWQALARWLRCLLGLWLLWLAWLAVVQARAVGVNFLLSVLTLVWLADVAAYFAGKAWGGRWVARKLAPSISPGKSWEGAIGGAAAVLVVGLLWSSLEAPLALSAAPSLHAQVRAGHGVGLLVAALLFLTAMSVVGDLTESLLKRSAGVKDSSALLPGHGGVLDRIDALLPVLPLAMMLWSFSR